MMVSLVSPDIPRRSELRSQSCTGELPLALIRMKAKGCEIKLSGNKGFTLPSNIGELGDDIAKLDFYNCSLRGKFASASQEIPRAEAN